MIAGWLRNTILGRSHVAYKLLERGLDRIRWRLVERGEWEDDRLWYQRWRKRRRTDHEPRQAADRLGGGGR